MPLSFALASFDLIVFLNAVLVVKTNRRPSTRVSTRFYFNNASNNTLSVVRD